MLWIRSLTQLRLRKPRLGRAAPFHRLGCGRFHSSLRFGIGCVETVQYFVGRILQPCIRLVKLTGCLARELTKLIAIRHMRKCPKNEIRTHAYLLLIQNLALIGPMKFRQCCNRELIQSRATRNCYFHLLDALRISPVQNLWDMLHVVKWKPLRTEYADCT
jgi:hypothetical protein